MVGGEEEEDLGRFAMIPETARTLAGQQELRTARGGAPGAQESGREAWMAALMAGSTSVSGPGPAAGEHAVCPCQARALCQPIASLAVAGAGATTGAKRDGEGYASWAAGATADLLALLADIKAAAASTPT